METEEFYVGEFVVCGEDCVLGEAECCLRC